jgi:hypothetical protein
MCAAGETDAGNKEVHIRELIKHGKIVRAKIYWQTPPKSNNLCLDMQQVCTLDRNEVIFCCQRRAWSPHCSKGALTSLSSLEYC